jgi:hypothetical protein
VGDREGSAVASVVAPLANAALDASVSATSTLGQNTAEAAVDGDATTRWESVHGSDDESLTVDLGERYDLARVRIDWEAAAAQRYRLDVADDADGPWRTVQTVDKTDAGDDVLEIAETARFVRMQGETRLTGYGYSIEELEVFGTRAVSAENATVVLVGPRRASVASGASVQLAAYAFDDAGNGGPADAEWQVSEGEGTVEDGRYRAPSTAGTAIVRAGVGAASGDAEITIGGGAPTEPAAERDIAAGKPVTASSREAEQFDARFAVDGRAATRWSSAHEDAQWIEVDLGEPAELTRVVLDWESAHARDYEVQVRDSAAQPWRTVATETDGRAGRAEHDVAGATARFVRVSTGERATPWGFSLTGFAVLSREGTTTADLTADATATASSTEGPFAAANAIDGDPGTRWASDSADGEWLMVDLGAAHPVSLVELQWEDAYGRGYVIEGSDAADGPWRTLATVTDGDGADDRVALEPATVRYVRLRGVERATAYGYSLYSFVVR